MATYRSSLSLTLIRVFLGAFFIVLGISGVFPELRESVFSISFHYNWIEVVFGITEIVCGLLILLGFFIFSDTRTIYWGSLIALIFWVIRIIMTKFMNGLSFVHNSKIDIPDFFAWLLILFCELIIAAALLVLIRKHD